MKKILKLSFVALSCALLAVSCDKAGNELTPDNPSEANPAAEVVTISARLSEALTKVALDPDVDGSGKAILKLAWKSTDKLIVADHDNTSSFAEFDLVSGDGDAEATFSGTLPAGASTYDVSIKTSGTVDYNTIKQAADNDASHLEYIAAKKGLDNLKSVVFDEVCGVLGITAKLPADVTETVRSVSIEASEAIFNGGNTLNIDLYTASDADNDDILRVYAPLPATSQGITAGTTLLIRFNDRYTRFITLGAATLTPGKLNEIKVNCSHTDQYAGGNGTSADNAYLIGDAYQVAAINGLATGGNTTYFKMIDNVDMDGVTHNYINTNSGYTQVVDFDGNGKSISRLNNSLFYVFKGSIHDLTLNDADITTRGILAEYCQGSGNIITNVNVTDCDVNSSDGYVGGLIGQINEGTGDTAATITNCTVSGTDVTGPGVVGGFIGFANELVSISGCSFTDGTVTASAKYCGGFVGSTANKASIITDCHVESATITSNCVEDARCGGFVGQLQANVQIKGCTVGTDAEKVVVNTAKPTSGKVLNAGGFVGVNYGTITKNGDVRSKAYVQVKSANDQGQQINIGGFAGFHRGTIEFCDAVVDMSDLQGQYIGGFSGYMPSEDSKADNCTLKGSVRGNNYTGGFVGVVDNATSITNCQVLAGTVVVGQSTAGGFAAQIKAGTVEDCSANVDMQCRGGNDGGFVGALTGGTVQRCSSAGTLSRISGTNSTFGGFAGYVNGVNLTKCSSTVNIDIASSNVGGLVGDFQTANTVSECYYNGTISNPTNTKGGLIGVTQAAVIITNCYTAGELVGSSGTQIFGGIVGELKAGGSVTNCYSTMDMAHGSRAMGGIVGRACSGGWPVSNASNNTISKCIAWNPNITFDGTASTSASSGAIVGYTSFKNILNNCYRRYDMVYKNSNTATGTTCQTSMVDQIDCDGTNWAVNGNRPAGGTPAGTSADAQYQAPYYGVAAASTATVSSIARSLGWSSDVWDFTGDLPTLK